MALVKNNKAKIGETAEKQHLIHTFSAIFRKSPNLHQIHSTTKFSGSKYIFCFSRYIFIDSGPPAKPESAGQCPQSNWNLSISCYGAGAPCLPLTREVPRRGGGRETSCKDLGFSLPQSASLTAPSSEGAFGVRCMTERRTVIWSPQERYRAGLGSYDSYRTEHALSAATRRQTVI